MQAVAHRQPSTPSPPRSTIACTSRIARRSCPGSPRRSPSAIPTAARRVPERRRTVDRRLRARRRRRRGTLLHRSLSPARAWRAPCARSTCISRDAVRARVSAPAAVWARPSAQEFPHDRLTGLQCHVCHAPFPAEALFVCDKCFGPLEAVYDYDVARTHADPRGHRGAAAQPVALPRAAADHRRAAHRLHLGLHAAGHAPTAWPRASASASSTSRTTASTTRPCPTRIAWCRSRRRAPSSSGSRCSAAPRPATSATASRRMRPASASTATSSSPTTSSPARSSAPASTSRS